MQNPSKVLPEYLQRLIQRFQNLKSLRKQLYAMLSWQTPASRREALDLGSYFFRLAFYSLSRTILTEVSALLSESEDRSVVDWLNKAHEAAPNLSPSIYDPKDSGSGIQPIQTKEYREIVAKQRDLIDRQRDLIGRVKARRDKSIAHLDGKYFDDPGAVYRDFPLKDTEVDTLFDIIEQILVKQHSLLEGHQLSMDIASPTNVDVILRYSRAFARARKDKDLIQKGFRPGDYLKD